ncbi:hypothetical protein EUTSA_v10026924mg, partial [Eutrema salsugineum]
FSSCLVISFTDQEGEIVLPSSTSMLKMVVDDFPTWLSDVDKKLLLDSTSELKKNADVIVAKDGTGKFKTVKEAVAAAPENSKTRYVIYVKLGIYDEVVNITKEKTNLTIVGDGRDSTVLTGSLNAKDGYTTLASATLAVDAIGFLAQDLCIRNTAGPAKGQAVALRVSADLVVIHRCRIEAFQDTLYAYKYRQYYRECYITGTVDFICGDATAVFQYCQIEARNPHGGLVNVITAQSWNNMTEESTGFVIQKCNITATQDLLPIKRKVKTYLGRPWGILSRVVIMESFIDDLIAPEGYTPMNSSDVKRLSTLFYREYKNTGPGADTSKRVKWKGFKVITDPKEVEMFTVGEFIQGDLWINSTGVPYDVGL